MITAMRLRNQAISLKIQLATGESFHVFSCVANHAECVASMKDEKQWKFWPDALVAVHARSISTLAAASVDAQLKWAYEGDHLTTLDILVPQTLEWNDLIERVSGEVLSAKKQ